jgi:lipopolysaccharide export system permease protein
MRIPRTVAAYIAREIIQYSVLGFLVFASLMLTQNLLRTLSNLAEAAGTASAADLVQVLIYLAPVLATYALPVAFLFGVLLAVGRLASESEILAMRACGLGMSSLMAPVLALALGVSAITGYLMQEVEPQVRQKLRVVVTEAAKRSLTIAPGHFHAFDKRVVYAGGAAPDGALKSVVIWDKSNPERHFTVFAETGEISLDPKLAVVHLRLQEGDMHFEPNEAGRYQRLAFATFDYEFDVSDFVENEAARLRPRDMSMAQLSATYELVKNATAFEEIEKLPEKRAKAYQTQIHRRYAIPFAPVVFALLAVPLGLRRVRGARSAGALVCVALAFAYYALLSMAEFLAEETSVPPFIALWLPNVVFLMVALPLLNRARRGET